MALSETVYSPDYPNNSKTVSVDIVRRVPLGAEGDEKYLLYICTTAYSDNEVRTAIDPVYLHHIKRGWAESHPVTSPVSLNGLGFWVAIDEGGDGVFVPTVSGSYSGSTIAAQIQENLRAVASGVRADSYNKLSYLNALCEFEDNKFRIISGSVKSSYQDTMFWKNTSSVKVKVSGSDDSAALGFTLGYPNSFDLAVTASGNLHAPASAIATIDDAIRYGIENLMNQMDFS
jgi:hypothetical protein